MSNDQLVPNDSNHNLGIIERYGMILFATAMVLMFGALVVEIYNESNQNLSNMANLLISLGAGIIMVVFLHGAGRVRWKGFELVGGAAVVFAVFFFLDSIKVPKIAYVPAAGIEIRVERGGRLLNSSEYSAGWQSAASGAINPESFATGSVKIPLKDDDAKVFIERNDPMTGISNPICTLGVTYRHSIGEYFPVITVSVDSDKTGGSTNAAHGS